VFARMFASPRSGHGERKKRTRRGGSADTNQLPIGTPRPTRPRLTTVMAGLLAHGSPPCAAFPAFASGMRDARLTAYSCGGSHGIDRACFQDGLTVFPFDPRREPSTHDRHDFQRLSTAWRAKATAAVDMPFALADARSCWEWKPVQFRRGRAAVTGRAKSAGSQTRSRCLANPPGTHDPEEAA
jgi:hypothetical protein